MRFKDSPGLFGVGIGHGTCGDIQCGVCNKKYNQGEDELGEYLGDSVTHTLFAGIDVCDCCFERIEDEIWRQRKQVSEWLTERIQHEQTMIDADKTAIDGARALLTPAPATEGKTSERKSTISPEDVDRILAEGVENIGELRETLENVFTHPDVSPRLKSGKPSAIENRPLPCGCLPAHLCDCPENGGYGPDDEKDGG